MRRRLTSSILRQTWHDFKEYWDLWPETLKWVGFGEREEEAFTSVMGWDGMSYFQMGKCALVDL
jgi:hypothetical protein